MVQIQNSEAIEAIRNSAGLSYTEALPTNLDTSKVVAVLDMTPRTHKVTDLVKVGLTTNTGAATIFTTSSTRDTYITGIAFSYAKDATCDSASSSQLGITATINGVAVTLFRLASITLTADTKSVFVTFPFPLKLDRATNVTVTSVTFSVGSLTRGYSVFGYEV